METPRNQKVATRGLQPCQFHRHLYLVYLLLCAALVLGTSVLAQAACWSDVLASRNADFLVMRSGAAYRVLEGAAITAFWAPLARVTICEQVVVNVNGEMAPLYEIRNQDGNQLVNAARER